MQSRVSVRGIFNAFKNSNCSRESQPEVHISRAVNRNPGDSPGFHFRNRNPGESPGFQIAGISIFRIQPEYDETFPDNEPPLTGGALARM
eukprot:scaffold11659_cov89-Skeletonema_dohrnii-CCMP3373.AAC.5